MNIRVSFYTRGPTTALSDGRSKKRHGVLVGGGDCMGIILSEDGGIVSVPWDDVVVTNLEEIFPVARHIKRLPGCGLE